MADKIIFKESIILGGFVSIFIMLFSVMVRYENFIPYFAASIATSWPVYVLIKQKLSKERVSLSAVIRKPRNLIFTVFALLFLTKFIDSNIIVKAVVLSLIMFTIVTIAIKLPSFIWNKIADVELPIMKKPAMPKVSIPKFEMPTNNGLAFGTKDKKVNKEEKK